MLPAGHWFPIIATNCRNVDGSRCGRDSNIMAFSLICILASYFGPASLARALSHSYSSPKYGWKYRSEEQPFWKQFEKPS